jgi:hypothetical protein
MRIADLGPTTDYIVADEKAMGLQEVDVMSDDYKELRRVQIIYVPRNDVLTKYVTDLGPTIRFPNPPLNVYSQMEHTVAELQEIALEAKDRSNVVSRVAALHEEAVTDHNIVKEFLERKDAERKTAYNKSHYGPTTKVQRIGYSRREK